MAYPYQMNMGYQQPNFAGGMNSQMPGQAPNMGVPSMGVPPAPMPYQPQPMFGMPQTYSPYPQQQSYGQTSYSPASSPAGQQMNWNAIPDFRQFGNMGGYKFTEPMYTPPPPSGNQQPIGGLGQPANTPQYTTYSAGPMGLPVTIDQSLMGGAPATGSNTQSSYAQYNFDPVTQEYLDRMEKRSAMVPDMGTWRYEPATQSFINVGAFMPPGVPAPRITLAEMQQRAKADAAARASSPDQSPFGVKPIAVQTGAPPTGNTVNAEAGIPGWMRMAPSPERTKQYEAWRATQPADIVAQSDAAMNYTPPTRQSPFAVNTTAQTGAPKTAAPVNNTPMSTPTPQQIAKRNMMNLQQSLLEAGSRGPAGLQRFLDQLPKTGLTPQQIRAQQQAQMQLRNQQRLRNPSLSADPFTYTPRPAAPVMPAPTPQVNQVTRRMNPNGTFSVVR